MKSSFTSGWSFTKSISAGIALGELPPLSAGAAHLDLRIAAQQAERGVVVELAVAGGAGAVHPGRLVPDLEVPVGAHLVGAVALFQVGDDVGHELLP